MVKYSLSKREILGAEPVQFPDGSQVKFELREYIILRTYYDYDAFN